MARYQAQNQSLYGQVGAPNPPRGGVDVAGAIDALTSGATSLIHGAMLRRSADNEIAARNAEIEARKQQLSIEQNRETREAANQEREFGLRQESERHRFIEAGGIPAHTETQAVPGTAAITPLNPAPSATPSPIRSAMTSGMPPVQAPIPAAGAPGGPQGGSVTAYHPENTDVPETYDPTKSRAFEQAVATQSLRNQGWTTREAARDELQRDLADKRIAASRSAAEVAQNGRVALERMRETARGSKVAGAMTGNARAKVANETADGLMNRFGSYDDAKAWIDSNDPEAVKLRGMEKDLPVSWHQYLDNAHSRYIDGQTKAAMSLQRGSNGLGSEAAVKTVNRTRDLVSAPKAAGVPANGAPATAPSAAPSARRLATPASTPAALPAAAPAPPAAPAKQAAVDESKLSDADLWEQKVAAGMPKDKATAYVRARKRP